MSIAPFSFKREVFIRDLFTTKHLLNIFGEITFENFSSYLESIQSDFILTGTRTPLRVGLAEKDLPTLKTLLEGSSILSGESSITFQINPSLLKNEEFLSLLKSSYPFAIELGLDEIEYADLDFFLKQAIESFRDWISKNRVEIYVSVNAQNFRNQINSIIEIFNKSAFRFFRVDFDYESLNNLSFSEFDELRLRLQELIKVWPSVTDKMNMKLEFSNAISRRIFVDKDLKLYVNSYAKRDGESILDLKDYPKGASGEDINLKDLNIFRAYIDCPKYVLPFDEDLLIQKGLKHIIDPYFNKKLTRSYTMVPTITKSLLLSLI